jgi:hypothetical protein
MGSKYSLGTWSRDDFRDEARSVGFFPSPSASSNQTTITTMASPSSESPESSQESHKLGTCINGEAFRER